MAKHSSFLGLPQNKLRSYNPSTFVYVKSHQTNFAGKIADAPQAFVTISKNFGMAHLVCFDKQKEFKWGSFIDRRRRQPKILLNGLHDMISLI